MKRNFGTEATLDSTYSSLIKIENYDEYDEKKCENPELTASFNDEWKNCIFSLEILENKNNVLRSFFFFFGKYLYKLNHEIKSYLYYFFLLLFKLFKIFVCFQ